MIFKQNFVAFSGWYQNQLCFIGGRNLEFNKGAKANFSKTQEGGWADAV